MKCISITRALCAAFAPAILCLAPTAEAQKAKAPPSTPANAPQASPAAVAGEVANEEINVAVGETYTLSARGVRNWSEGVAGVIEVKLTSDGGQFLVSGKRPGSTTLMLLRESGQQTYTVNVFAKAPGSVEHELRQLLDGFTNVRVRRVGARHVIDGAVADDKEKARVDHIASLYPGQVDSMVFVGAAKPTGVGDVPPAQKEFLVRIDFYFVQMDASSGYAVGIGWPASIGGGNALRATGTFDVLTGQVAQGAVTVNQPLPRLDLAASKGWGKVLKHATVVTNSGEAAKFRSGGSQNFTVNTGLTVGLQTIPFGVEVNVVPRFDPVRRDLSLRIGSDVSDLTSAGPGTSVPGKTESKLETVVNVKLGQSIVLSGIRTRSQTHNVNGLPILSEIPILGLLFGSHQNTTQETEGAIYIIPSVLETVPTSSMELIDEAVRQFDDFSGNHKKTNLYPHKPPSAR